jgi:dinuclear metal center YbgI/SA1388 family protein
MKLKDLISDLDVIFQKNIALENDPVGLQTGNLGREIDSILVTLDVTSEVANEAIKLKAGLIISHHPLIFNPIFKITDDNVKSEILMKLILNGIAVYSAHTNLDAMIGGLNDGTALKLGLKDIKIIEEVKKQWFKFIVFVPPEAEQKIREAIFAGGGGNYANYSCCTFNLEGKGTFKPLSGSNPYTGKVGRLETVEEIRIECVVDQLNLKNVVCSVLAAHPYEEPAFDILKLENSLNAGGLGRYGILDPAVNLDEFLEIIKTSFDLKNFRWIAGDGDKSRKRKIKKVAVLNGSANSFAGSLSAIENEFDAVIVGEFRHQNALAVAENGGILVEIGHGESESPAIDLIYDLLMSGNYPDKGIKLYKTKKGYFPWRYHIE